MVVRVGGDDGELRPWHYIDVLSVESRLMMRVRYTIEGGSIMSHEMVERGGEAAFGFKMCGSGEADFGFIILLESS